MELMVNKLALALIGLSALLALAAGWIILRSTHQAQSQPGLRGTATERQPSEPVLSSTSAVQEASQRLVAVQESVRREMADYLHGHVQSKLLALSLSLGMCQKMLEQDPAHAYRMLERIQDELQRLQDEDLWQVSRELYPAIVKMGLVPAVRSLVSRFSDMMEIDLAIDQKVFALDAASQARLPEGQRLGVYRIAEEALNNVLKHAKARHAQVSLTCDAPDRLVLSVVDDGRGFDPASVATCHGLVMMSDYAEAIGGKTQITSTPGRGTIVRLTLLLSTTDLPARASRGAEAEQLSFHSTV
jgi:signal transduction histidine kinase